jgi:hypothetical protein
VITFAGGHQVLTFADHGLGLIICPDPGRDRAYPGATSLQAEEWTTVLARLRLAGWELSRGAAGEDRRLVGATADGRAAYELVATSGPIADAALAGAVLAELCRAAGVRPSP